MVPNYENRQKTSSDPLAFCVKPEIGRFEKKEAGDSSKIKKYKLCIYIRKKSAKQQNIRIIQEIFCIFEKSV